MSIARKQRAFHQPIYLLKMFPTNTQFERKFNVVGTTGNVYTVTINKRPSCSCPDYVHNKNVCKHIYFIMLRVMKIKSEVVKYYTDDTIKCMFDNIPHFISDNVAFNENVKKIYCEQIKKNVDLNSVSPVETKITQKLDDICPVCLEDILVNSDLIDYCKYSCGKSIHKECFAIWKCNNGANNCLFCRHNWDDDPVDAGIENDKFDDDEQIYEMTHYEKLYKVSELRNLCNDFNLSNYGTKKILINRLRNNGILD